MNDEYIQALRQAHLASTFEEREAARDRMTELSSGLPPEEPEEELDDKELEA